MKKQIFRAFALVLAVMMVLMAVGCGGTTVKKAHNKVEDVVFPLKEPVTFTFMISGTETSSFKSDLANNKLWQRLKQETNVNVEFQFLGSSAAEKFSLLVSSGGYGDVLAGGPIVNSVEASKYIAAGKFQPITDYITERSMPELYKDIQENKNIYKMITASDGEIYCLPKITGSEGHYLESPIWINKAWLDKLGLSVPTTTDEFIKVLRAFRDKDPNGNGLPDEIPYIACTSHSYMHTEALLGMFGIATKDGTNDSFVQVIDGKVTFMPITDAYKDGIKFLNQLYTEGLMWGDCFTANTSTLNAKLTNDTCVVGCFTSTTPASSDYEDDYVCIAPPKAPGYTTCWYYHPAIDGSKNQFYVTDKCKNLSVLMAWMDKFYDLEIALEYEYGSVGDGRIVKNADGTYTILEVDTVESAKLSKDKPTLNNIISTTIRSFTSSDYATKVTLPKNEQIMQKSYLLYKDVINKELWPRPYYAPEDAYDADVYYADIDYQVVTNRAMWVTGKADVEKDWDKFVAKIKSLGIDEYLRILQKAYDAYNGNK